MQSGNNENWVAGSNFDTQINDFIDNFGSSVIRSILVDYASEYHDQFEFECVDDALLFLQVEDVADQAVLEAVPVDVVESVQDGMNEYGFSIVAISTAVMRLLMPKPILSEDARYVLNHIWEAWSCNDLEFRDREDSMICSMLLEYKKG